MSDINWKENAVCYINGRQRNHESIWINGVFDDEVGIDDFDDFQLNEIKVGDFIPASELDTEQKYNEVVEVFGLFGFDTLEGRKHFGVEVFKVCSDKNLSWCKRKLTHSQIIAIGKLKRMMLDKVEAQLIEKSTHSESPKTSIDYLNECVEVQKQRGEQYDSTGTGERSFDAAANAYNAITGGNLKGSDVCLILTCVKAVRQYSNPERLHEDSLLDLVSYASLWAEELNKELK